MTLDVLFLAWNRMEFTSATWRWLLSNTAWEMVSKLVVYDDGSFDGTLEFLRERIHDGHAWSEAGDAVCAAELRVSDLRSPPAVMNHYLATSEADLFAKVDNDIAVPSGWLEALCGVMADNRHLDLLGMEAGMVELAGRDGKKWDGIYRAEPCTNIGGVGLMRVAAFRRRPPIPSRGRFGFTEWQQRYDVPRAWITPDLHCPQLDRLPFPPYSKWTERYIEEGWSRGWTKYDQRWTAPYYEWLLKSPP